MDEEIEMKPKTKKISESFTLRVMALRLLRLKRAIASAGVAAPIQHLEFGEVNLDSRTYYHDFNCLLSKDFVIHRIASNGLRPQLEYHPVREVFATMNSLAVRKNQ